MKQGLPLLSNREVEQLIAGKAISAKAPWKTNEEQEIENHLRRVVDSIVNHTNTESKVEWNHYGSGYASFVDAWFYRRTPDFRVEVPLHYGEVHTGLVVLLSRLTPYFVLMEGEKSWSARGGGSYLPSFEMLDAFKCREVARLGKQVQEILENNGLVRAHRGQLSCPLSPEIEIETNLSSGALLQFDALFYWYD
jgi:hypothetical protein